MEPILPSPIDQNEKLLLPKRKEHGPLVGVIIVIVVLVFGALYFWGAYLNTHTSPTPSTTAS